MADPGVSDWYGLGALVTALGALVAPFARRTVKRAEVHAVRDKAEEAILRVAVVETRLGDIDRRLGGIEKGQEKIADKLDRVLESR